jgi:hypothetical protein
MNSSESNQVIKLEARHEDLSVRVVHASNPNLRGSIAKSYRSITVLESRNQKMLLALWAVAYGVNGCQRKRIGRSPLPTQMMRSAGLKDLTCRAAAAGGATPRRGSSRWPGVCGAPTESRRQVDDH